MGAVQPIVVFSRVKVNGLILLSIELPKTVIIILKLADIDPCSKLNTLESLMAQRIIFKYYFLVAPLVSLDVESSSSISASGFPKQNSSLTIKLSSVTGGAFTICTLLYLDSQVQTPYYLR
ncbi:hypothetical protein TorRG33x02_059060 [Trema orientale]|uniref:Uncharacterized protein n=1 Tax=Trema orientale TaxID=63057 RepID=A0A2P5FKL8_TREOI|nr:hypothetical protein TorRG33x02_059060 [Trema orientale]